jgi:endonuclease/exonuclease/phosphatase family metal-dependent hydrolase
MRTVKIMQWSIWFHENYQNIIQFIKKVNPDIVCAQELTINYNGNPDVNVAEEIAKACDYKYFFHPTTIYDTEGKPGSIGNGIFSRFPIVASKHVYVQKADPNIRSYETEDRTYVEAVLDVSGKKLKIGTVHLSYSAAFTMTEKRLEEADCLYEAVQGNHERFILTGDMNAKPGSPIIKKLEEMFMHADPNTDRPTWTTKPFSYQGFEADKLDWRLDYIFATEDINVVSNKILETPYSDHLPILSEISI